MRNANEGDLRHQGPGRTMRFTSGQWVWVERIEWANRIRERSGDPGAYVEIRPENPEKLILDGTDFDVADLLHVLTEYQSLLLRGKIRELEQRLDRRDDYELEQKGQE